MPSCVVRNWFDDKGFGFIAQGDGVLDAKEQGVGYQAQGSDGGADLQGSAIIAQSDDTLVIQEVGSGCMAQGVLETASPGSKDLLQRGPEARLGLHGGGRQAGRPVP